MPTLLIYGFIELACSEIHSLRNLGGYIYTSLKKVPSHKLSSLNAEILTF